MTLKLLFQRIVLIGAFCLVTSIFACTAYMIYRQQDPEVRLESFLLDEHKQIHRALFSPDDTVKNVLIELINAEKRKIQCAIYMLTDKEIAQAFIQAHKRGIALEFVVDRCYGSDKFTKISELANHQIPIWVYQVSAPENQTALMHDKFCIFSDNIAHKSLLWTGSYNFTRRANTSNQENVIILDDASIIEQFSNQFAVLKKRSLAISGITEQYGKDRNEEKSEPWWYSLQTFLLGGK